MSWSNQPSLWQRHYVIEQTATAFYELELKYPLVAERARSGAINRGQNTSYAFREGDTLSDIFNGVFGDEPLIPELEAENQAWRDFVKAMCGLAGQIFYASRSNIEPAKNQNSDIQALCAHGEATIAKLVSPYWKSLAIYGKYWLYDEDLRALIESVVERQSELNASLEAIGA